MSPNWKRMAVACVATLVIGIVPVSAAQATVNPIATCSVGVFAIHYSPGVLLAQSQNITTDVEYRFTNCAGDLSHLLLSSGTADFSNLATGLSCLALAQPFNVTFPIVWDIGQTSTVAVTNLVAGATVVVTGTVTSGLYQGQTIVITLQSLPISTAVECVTDGLKLVAGTATLVVLPV